MQQIIFTDLDGTLLNKKYSYSAANQALKLIKKQKIPLIICTSKTYAEIEYYRKKLKNKEPFISGNGGGIYIPKKYFDFKFKYDKSKPGYYVIELGTELDKLEKFADTVRKKHNLKFKTFTELSIKEISKDTGLPTKVAILARKRDYDLPIKILDEKNKDKIIKKLRSETKKVGLTFIKGTKYHHITGKNDKGKAVKILIALYKKKFKSITTVAFGDAKNDETMLKTVDKGYLIKKYDGSYESIKGIEKVDGIGPKAWSDKIIDIISS